MRRWASVADGWRGSLPAHLEGGGLTRAAPLERAEREARANAEGARLQRAVAREAGEDRTLEGRARAS